MGVAIEEVDAALQRVLAALDAFERYAAENKYDPVEHERLRKRIADEFQYYGTVIQKALNQPSKTTHTLLPLSKPTRDS